MSRIADRLIGLGLALGVAGVAAGGTVTVTSTEPGRFADAGATAWEREANLTALSRYLQALGARHLPAGQLLKIEVLDLDLAGTVYPSVAAGRDLRIARGRADIPRVRLRYSLEHEGQPTRSGEESLSDLNYMHSTIRTLDSDPLRFEKRLLERWFMSRFVEQRAAGG